jgi:hypothetical protein
MTERAPLVELTPHLYSPSAHNMDPATAAEDQPTHMDCTDESPDDNVNHQPTEATPTQPNPTLKRQRIPSPRPSIQLLRHRRHELHPLPR